jgi:hypothetical protein
VRCVPRLHQHSRPHGCLLGGASSIHQIGPEGFDILRNDLAGLMPRSLRSDHSIQTLLPP